MHPRHTSVVEPNRTHVRTANQSQCAIHDPGDGLLFAVEDLNLEGWLPIVRVTHGRQGAADEFRSSGARHPSADPEGERTYPDRDVRVDPGRGTFLLPPPRSGARRQIDAEQPA